MLKGALVALGIMVICAAIPIVHFVAFPISPFLGGYLGIKKVKVPKESYALKCLAFGGIVGLFVLMIAALLALFVSNAFPWSERLGRFIWIVVGVLGLYASSMSALGAMFSVIRTATAPEASIQEAAE